MCVADLKGCLNVACVQVSVVRVQPVVHVAEEETEVCQAINFNTWNQLLEVAQLQLLEELTCHLVPVSDCVLPVTQMGRDERKLSVLELEGVRDATFVAYEVPEPLCNLGLCDAGNLSRKILLDKDHA